MAERLGNGLLNRPHVGSNPTGRTTRWALRRCVEAGVSPRPRLPRKVRLSGEQLVLKTSAGLHLGVRLLYLPRWGQPGIPGRVGSPLQAFRWRARGKVPATPWLKGSSRPASTQPPHAEVTETGKPDRLKPDRLWVRLPPSVRLLGIGHEKVASSVEFAVAGEADRGVSGTEEPLLRPHAGVMEIGKPGWLRPSRLWVRLPPPVPVGLPAGMTMETSGPAPFGVG